MTVPELPGHTEDNPFKGLIALYLLADKLNEIITTNLVADEIIRTSEALHMIPSTSCVTLAFNSTIEGNPLRRLCKDYYVHEAAVGVLENLKEGQLPFQFIKEVLLELDRMTRHATPYDQRTKVGCVDREQCYYHQHDDDHPKCSKASA